MEVENRRIEKVPKWLKRIQQNSWEPEILLSGFVLVGLLQLPQYIDKLNLILTHELLDGNLGAFFSGSKLAVYILVFGLITHLFLRGVWVGYVGLSYTFPHGIRPEKLAYQPKFMKHIQSIPSLGQQVDRLEKICSSIFSTCFFMIMCIIGVMTGVSCFVLFFHFMDFITFNHFMRIFISYFGNNFDIFIAIVISFMAIDFITIGLFRKYKYVAIIFYPIHTFIGWITLSRFYRPIYYSYASNVNKIYLGVFLALFFATTIFGQILITKFPDNSILSQVDFYESGATVSFFSGYYADRNTAWESLQAQIPSPVVSSRYLEVTIKHFGLYEYSMYRYCDINKDSLEAMTEGAEKLKLDCVNRFYSVFIDGTLVDNPDWMYYFYQKEKRKGFISYLDTDGLESGKHVLEIKTKLKGEDFFAHINFYKE